MDIYQHINPVLLHIWGPIAIHWYGLMYLIGFILIWLLLRQRAKKIPTIWPPQQVNDLIFYAIIGVIIGGRLGYMLFYNFTNFLRSPTDIIQVWNGGMSFHGGLLGVTIMMLIFKVRYKKSFFTICDFITPAVPIGIACGRIGNFINAELWGKITTMPWGIIFPGAGLEKRHPSQLYEFLLEGIALFLLLFFYTQKPRPKMAPTAIFLLGYGLARIICEFFRVPDVQYGYLAFNWLTMGQILSLPMIIGGATLLIVSYKINYHE